MAEKPGKRLRDRSAAVRTMVHSMPACAGLAGRTVSFGTASTPSPSGDGCTVWPLAGHDSTVAGARMWAAAVAWLLQVRCTRPASSGGVYACHV